MTQSDTKSTFKATLQLPANPGDTSSWGFVVLPKTASEKLPRRGRTTVVGKLNGKKFQSILEPDGKLSHWLRVDQSLLDCSKAKPGETVSVEIMSADAEQEPELPADFATALHDSPDALAVWQATTTIARIDWIHWIVSAKQAKTRSKRISDALDMLASGKKRVCCFDQSGFYSKALSAPKAAG